MPLFRYDTTKTWFKGNTHLHSTASDGGKTFEELGRLYADAGYNFLFRTDHWIPSACSADQNASPLLWLDGVELDGMDPLGAQYHVVCLGTFKDIYPGMGLVEGFDSARAQDGIIILAHPFWTGNSLEEALRWDFDGVEIYNHICHGLNGKGVGRVHWDAMLQKQPATLALAVDDVHLNPDLPFWNGGWIMVNAAECSEKAIRTAIREGNFYSSCGPVIQSIEFAQNDIHIQTSPVKYIRLVGPAEKGKRRFSETGESIIEAAFEIEPGWKYYYLEIEDEVGRCAWTNPLFV